MNVNIVNGFSDRPDGGNPAGVVYLSEGDGCQVTEGQMQQIAAKLGFSETAFITRLEDDRFKIRYFTPAAEVPLCGHATIASFSYLYQKGVIGDGTYRLVTIEAELTVEVTAGIVWMEMDRPAMEQVLDEQMVSRICAAYEITPSDLDDTLEVRIVTSGLRDIHVCVKNRDILLGAKQHEAEVTAISKELDVVGVHMSCLGDCVNGKMSVDGNKSVNGNKSADEKAGVTAYCSNYAPLYEIPEECATGTSNGGLTFYLYNKGLIRPEEVNCFLQGEHMERPSKVYTKVREEGGVVTVWVGGCGVICQEGATL